MVREGGRWRWEIERDTSMLVWISNLVCYHPFSVPYRNFQRFLASSICLSRASERFLALTDCMRGILPFLTKPPISKLLCPPWVNSFIPYRSHTMLVSLPYHCLPLLYRSGGHPIYGDISKHARTCQQRSARKLPPSNLGREVGLVYVALRISYCRWDVSGSNVKIVQCW